MNKQEHEELRRLALRRAYHSVDLRYRAWDEKQEARYQELRRREREEPR